MTWPQRTRRTMTVFLVHLVLCWNVEASELKLSWAGLSFLGEAEDTATLYPHSLSISKEKPQGAMGLLQAKLRAIVDSATPPNYEFRAADSELVQLASASDALVMAFVVDREEVAVERIRDDFKVVVDLSAQALVFDYSEKKVVAAFPVATQLIDVVEGAPPTEDHIRGLVRSLYFSDTEGSVNILRDFSALLARQPVKRKYAQRVMVRPMTLAPEVLDFFPDDLKSRPKVLGSSFGKLFAKHLSVNQLVSILPASKGRGVGGVMALQFANDNEALNLKLPDASYEIKLRLTTLKRVLYDEKPSASTWVYGAYIEVTADCGLDLCFEDMSFKQGLSKVIPANQAESADWPVYWEVINELADGLTMQMRKKPDKKWLKKHTKDKRARKGLQALAKKLEGCK